MFRTKFAMLLAGVMMVLRDNPEGGGGGGDEDPGTVPERPESITEDEWEDATPEERRAMVMDGTGEVGGYIDGTEDDPGEEDGLTDEELAAVLEGETEGEKTAEAEVAEVTAPPAEEQNASEPGNLPSDEDLLAFQPAVLASEIKVPSLEIPAEITQKIADLDAKEDALEVKFADAEISSEEYRKEIRQINRDREAVKDEKNEWLQTARDEARDNARADVIANKIEQAFISARPEYAEKDDKGEFTLKADTLYGALEKAVERITKQNPGMPLMQRLIKADKEVKSLFNITKAPDKKEIPPAASKKGVKTLSHVPIAAENDTSDPFSALDRLSGEALEKAIERLTPAQRERYEARY